MAGTIVVLNVQERDRVRKGHFLAEPRSTDALAALARTRISSPIDGGVLARHALAGEPLKLGRRVEMRIDGGQP